ncbi:MAG: zinc-ribbon domain containing protein [Terracidiphilus sp.]
MELVDRELRCFQCGMMFVFSVGEQAFFKDKGFVNDPKHCKPCKGLRGRAGRRTVETQIKCSDCGSDTTVPFKPTQNRPVRCRACFDRTRRGAVIEQPGLTPN